MALNKTKGGLTPAKIINLTTNQEVKFMFNPFEFTLTKANKWTEKDTTGLNIPEVEFKGGGSVSLKLTLHFDTQTEGGDVRTYTDPIWKMMMISDADRNDTTNKGQPPPVAFQWGRVYLKAIITNISQKFTLFSEMGVPLRCTVDVTLKQFADENDSQSQVPGQSPGAGANPTTTVVQGQRIDHVSTNQREVAERNNIDDPLNLPPGQVLE